MSAASLSSSLPPTSPTSSAGPNSPTRSTSPLVYSPKAKALEPSEMYSDPAIFAWVFNNGQYHTDAEIKDRYRNNAEAIDRALRAYDVLVSETSIFAAERERWGIKKTCRVAAVHMDENLTSIELAEKALAEFEKKRGKFFKAVKDRSKGSMASVTLPVNMSTVLRFVKDATKLEDLTEEYHDSDQELFASKKMYEVLKGDGLFTEVRKREDVTEEILVKLAKRHADDHQPPLQTMDEINNALDEIREQIGKEPRPSEYLNLNA
jgi:hypothetical protein